MTPLAALPIALGVLQVLSASFGLRGLSLTGSHKYPGIMAGVALIVLGIWLAVGVPWWLLLLSAIPASILAVLILSAAGVITNITWNPAARLFCPHTEDNWTSEDVYIPVKLKHVFRTDQGAQHDIPGTLLVPRPADPAGSNAQPAAVLVICGAGDDRKAFKWRLFAELLAQGIAILTIDPPGHGDFLSVPMTVDNASSASKSALDWLGSRFSRNRLGVCGISLGGCQAATLAAEVPDVQATALISTPIHLKKLTRRTYTREVLSLFIWPRNWNILQEGSFRTLWREWRSPRGAQFGENLYEMIERMDALSAVRAIGNRPKLIVHGSRDAAIPMQHASMLYEAAAPPHELLIVRQATHLTPILYRHEMHYLAAWFAKWLNYNRTDAR